MRISYFIVFFIFFSRLASGQEIIDTFYRSGFHISATLDLYENAEFIKKSNSNSCVIKDGEKPTSKSVLFGDYVIRGFTSLDR